jgi:hypothetical protein
MNLSEIEKFARRFVILPEPAYLPTALWILSTYVPDAFDCLPYLAIQSPVKRSGKTRLLEVLELLCRRPWRGTAITSATLFRMMAEQPTLLLDEVEGLKRGRSETAQAIVAVLNAGHRKGATVPRCAGDGLTYFDTYCPKAFATIHELPDTLQDRSIVIKMERKRKEQATERFLFSIVRPQVTPLKESAETWAMENVDAIRLTYETTQDVPFLSDRDADLWRPLFALCELLAPDRISELRWSARRLSSAKEGTSESTSLLLLEATRAVWSKTETIISTADLIKRIKMLREWRPVQITPRLLAGWLRPFEVTPKQIRMGEATLKGYSLEGFRIAWSRFLDESETIEAVEIGEAA